MTDSGDELKSLYPFLHQQKRDVAAENAALLESVRQKVQHGLDVGQNFFASNEQALIDIAQALAACYRGGGKLLSMGNGGSSCDASHVAVEFQHPVTAGRPGLPAINLANDNAFMTAVANDVGVRHIFARQVETHGKPGDCLIGFSTSGNSENLLAGFHKAREMGLTCVGLSGGDGGLMKSSELLHHCLVIETDSIHRVQEIQVICYHILWDLTHTLLADHRGKLGETQSP